MAIRKPLIPLEGEIKTPSFTRVPRVEAGELLAMIQEGESLGLPSSRPMPSIGQHVGEPRVKHKSHNWRIIYRVDDDAILMVDVFDKKSQKTPKAIIESCKARLRRYDEDK